MATANNPRVVFKVLIIGDAMVGKSCVLQRYADNKYTENISPTIGVDYRPVYRKIRGHLTKLMIWDTAGQEKFKSITMSFYHGAHGAVIVYDVTQRPTLHHLTNWISELKRICGDIPFIIIGNKNDSSSKNRLSLEEISEFIEENGFTDQHFLVSALTSENISEAFEAITNILMDSVKAFAITEKRVSLEPQRRSKCSC